MSGSTFAARLRILRIRLAAARTFLHSRWVVIFDEEILPHLIGRIVGKETLKGLICQGIFPVAVIVAAHVADDSAVKPSFGKCRQIFRADPGRQHGTDIYIGIRRIFVVVDHDIMRLHKVIKIQDRHPEFPEIFLRQPLFQIIQYAR